MELRIAGTVNDSIVDGPGIRFTVFTQGCPHGCPGCHNPQTHDFLGGTVTDTDELLEKIKSNPLLDGVTFSGGEPFAQAQALAHLGRQIKELGMDVITYTGYTFRAALCRPLSEWLGRASFRYGLFDRRGFLFSLRKAMK